MATSSAELAAAVRRQRQLLDRETGQAEQVAVLGKAAEAEVAQLREDIELHDQVCALLTGIAEEAQESAREQVEGLATRALQLVFGPELSFRLRPGERGGQSILEPVVRAEYEGVVTEAPVLGSFGGGVAAVVGFVLRLVVLLLTPQLRQILILDEPFANVSARHAGAVARMLREITDMAGVQTFLVTHDPVYAEQADCRVRLVLDQSGTTKVLEGESE